MIVNYLTVRKGENIHSVKYYYPKFIRTFFFFLKFPSVRGIWELLLRISESVASS